MIHNTMHMIQIIRAFRQTEQKIKRMMIEIKEKKRVNSDISS